MEMSTDRLVQHETYCTHCKENVAIVDTVYIRLVNGRLIIKGKCSRCGTELLKASINTSSSGLASLKKKKRKKDKVSLRFI